uniref:ubiquitinyl hydrolase 1 n=1 Tax=Erpetoichthys calabaricus TaxID=27687 RepID=A0A8C4RRM2_ERPCA
MSNNSERSVHPSKMYLVRSDYQATDHLEGTILIPQGYLCQAQEQVYEMCPSGAGGQRRNRVEQLWVKVLDSGDVLKVDRDVLTEIREDFAYLLEPVSDLHERIMLIQCPKKLALLGSLEPGAKLRVQIHSSGSKAPGVLRYRGPLGSGSSGIHFGVQLQGSAAGKGFTNGTYKGHQFFQCPENCGVFVAVNRIELAMSEDRSRQSIEILSRTADSTSPLFEIGQRVYFQMEDSIQYGEVVFCGILPNKLDHGVFVGIHLENRVGSWDGFFKGAQLCKFPSPEYGILLPVSKVHKVPVVSVQISSGSSFLSRGGSDRKQQSRSLKSRQTDVSQDPESTNVRRQLTKKEQRSCSDAGERPGRSYFNSLEEQAGLARTLSTRLPHSDSSSSVDEKMPSLSSYWSTQSKPPGGEESPSSPQSKHSAEFLKNHNEEEAKLEVNSMVEVKDPPIYGVIRWIGEIKGMTDTVAGLELEEVIAAGTDGTYLGERFFKCAPNKGLFVKLKNCRPDPRFPAHQVRANQVDRCNSIAFAEWASEKVEEDTPPELGEQAKERFTGWKKGIQGNFNSCYLDATLFCLFSFSSVLDTVLLRPKGKNDSNMYGETQELLRSEIVNPLRKHGYVCATKIMTLRKILEAAGKSSGFTSEEKDPEEFLNKLFQVLKVEPLLRIRSGNQKPQDCYFYQLFPERQTGVQIPSVQQLLEWSFVHSRLKFSEAPSCLIIQMPRFGKDFKMFNAILPSSHLDITDLLDDTPRECSICQRLAVVECSKCYEEQDINPGKIKQFCTTCSQQVHRHRQRHCHRPESLQIPEGLLPEEEMELRLFPRQTLDLYAVLCIETSHYVSFVKHGPEDTDWLFFDSMADREGGQNGFNIPCVSPCPEVAPYLQMSAAELQELDHKSIQGSARRLLCDAYMCFYQSPSLSLYK